MKDAICEDVRIDGERIKVLKVCCCKVRRESRTKELSLFSLSLCVSLMTE